ncbi:MAG: hypothetical protein KDB33_15810 [Acidimicrobiales bacterium]|nr:hypothetical protein [Acidimicrobiales bacterium]
MIPADGPAADTHVDVLLARIAELEARLDALERPAPPPSDPSPEAARPVDRRTVLSKVGGAAAGLAGGVLLAGATPAAAANGNAVTIGSSSNQGSLPTGLAVDRNGSTNNAYGFGVTDRGLAAVPQGASSGVLGHTKGQFECGVAGYSEAGPSSVGVFGLAGSGYGVVGRGVAAGVLGRTDSTDSSGVIGHSTGTSGRGIEGEAFGQAGYGVLGRCDSPFGVGVRGVGSFRGVEASGGPTGAGILATGAVGATLNGTIVTAFFEPATTTVTDARGRVRGSFLYDQAGELWFCVASGTPGTWRKLAGPTTAGSLHLVTPVRVYDSRPGQQPVSVPKGVLASGQQREVDGTLGGQVPPGATGVLVTLTVTNTSTAGFLQAFAPGSAVPATSVHNWDHQGTNAATTTVVACSAAGRITVRCGGVGAATDVIVDVIGYYR